MTCAPEPGYPPPAFECTPGLVWLPGDPVTAALQRGVNAVKAAAWRHLNAHFYGPARCFSRGDETCESAPWDSDGDPLPVRFDLGTVCQGVA